MPVRVASHWLTTVRLGRLGQALRIVPASPAVLPRDQATRAVWHTCGGTFDEVSKLLDLLTDLDLISVHGEALKRTQSGSKILKSIRTGDLREFGLVFIRAGCFHDQGRFLIETGMIANDGDFVCPTKLARAVAPQLLGVLQWWTEVRVLPSVRIPRSLVEELNTVWALLPPAPTTPEWALERKEVGNRAEMYSVQYERTNAREPSKIIWVAQDSDELGWDIEDRSTQPVRCIEVKGRRDEEVLFFLSENEWAKAQALGPRHELHFWGGINLSREPATEYAALRAGGYPLVLRNVIERVADGSFEATAMRWRIKPANQGIAPPPAST
jgi:Domain of unknown function (DUF3883)